MKEAKKKIQKNLGVTARLLVLSILYTMAIIFIDVRSIGPQGSVVGFAAVNQYFHTLFGTNMLLYHITDWLSIPILFVMLGFAIAGLVQLIKRKSLLRVDSSILILGGFYVLVFLVYLFFEFFVVNFRPVLIEGFLEASYPSSTTMLMMCIIPTAIMQFQRLISNKRLKNIVNTLCGIYAAFVMLYDSINQWINNKASRA